LLERARQGAPIGFAAGRRPADGRPRPAWSQLAFVARAGLTFSLLWRFAARVTRLAGLSLAVGVAVARALERPGAAGVELKWPNDILLDGGKVGGILVELESAPAGMLAVIGIGLNLQMPPAGDDEFCIPPAALSQALSPLPDRHRLLAQLMIELAAVLDRFDAGGFAVLRDDWQAACLAGSAVRLLNGDRIDRRGDLPGRRRPTVRCCCSTATGIERCLSGDLSLRGA
jgi:BirA family biotin operon repressor/biotin-[acetyl-CoA-carboxylase] ligase